MDTIEGLQRRIQSTKELYSVVRTMKALAAASIRQYEEAVNALDQYSRTIELGYQIVLRQLPVNFFGFDRKSGRIGGIIIGSDQGMCGQFNDVITDLALARLKILQDAGAAHLIWIIGERLVGPMLQADYRIDRLYPVPGSVEIITERVQELLLDLEESRRLLELDAVYIFYNRSTGGASYRPHYQKLWPINFEWFLKLQKREWPARTIPTATINPKRLLTMLNRQYLFISIYRALAESLAAENAGRLVTMETAQKNIEERQEELESRYNRLRQSVITSELLDIISGFVALADEE